MGASVAREHDLIRRSQHMGKTPLNYELLPSALIYIRDINSG